MLTYSRDIHALVAQIQTFLLPVIPLFKILVTVIPKVEGFVLHTSWRQKMYSLSCSRWGFIVQTSALLAHIRSLTQERRGISFEFSKSICQVQVCFKLRNFFSLHLGEVAVGLVEN